MAAKKKVMACDPLVAESVRPHLEAVEAARKTIETQEMIVSKILSAHFEGFRIDEYSYNPNKQQFELKEKAK